MVTSRKLINNRWIGGTEYFIFAIYRYGFLKEYGVETEEGSRYCFLGDLSQCQQYLNDQDKKYRLEQYGF